jgi:hypothetical protein
MKLDVLDAGAPYDRVVRFFSFTNSEAASLGALAAGLACGDVDRVAVHEQAFVQPLDGVQLFFFLGPSDEVVKQTAPRSFSLLLSAAGWSRFSGLIEPFTEGRLKNRFQWLSGGFDAPEGEADILLSEDGYW